MVAAVDIEEEGVAVAVATEEGHQEATGRDLRLDQEEERGGTAIEVTQAVVEEEEDPGQGHREAGAPADR